MKSVLLLMGVLLFAASANAQRHSMPTYTGTSTWNGQYNPNTASRSGGGDGYGYGSGYGNGFHHSYGGGGHLSAPSHAVGQTSNDGPYVPTTLMDYNEAVALGKQQLAMAANAAQVTPGPSLADVARAYRAAKVKVGGTAQTGTLEVGSTNNPGIFNVSTGNSVTSSSESALADIARQFRASRNIVSVTHALAVQDNSGRLHVCDANGANCD